MNRMELIARLAGKRTATLPAKPAGLHVTAHPEEKATRKKPFDRAVYNKRGGRSGWFIADIENPAHRRKKWVACADAKAADWRPKFRKGKHWLTRVAEGWRK